MLDLGLGDKFKVIISIEPINKITNPNYTIHQKWKSVWTAYVKHLLVAAIVCFPNTEIMNHVTDSFVGFTDSVIIRRGVFDKNWAQITTYVYAYYSAEHHVGSRRITRQIIKIEKRIVTGRSFYYIQISMYKLPVRPFIVALLTFLLSYVWYKIMRYTTTTVSLGGFVTTVRVWCKSMRMPKITITLIKKRWRACAVTACGVY